MEVRKHDYKKLIVWQKALTLTIKVYKLTKKLPKEERFSLTDQLRRAAVSIPSNIAEGSGRMSVKEQAHFMSIALGSVYEVETQLIICTEVDYLSQDDVKDIFDLSSEVTRMLYSFIEKSKA